MKGLMMDLEGLTIGKMDVSYVLALNIMKEIRV